MKFKVTLTEQLYYGEIEVEADNMTEAVDKAQNIVINDGLFADDCSWDYTVSEVHND